MKYCLAIMLLFTLLSCEKSNIEPTIKAIPEEYNYVFKNLRALPDDGLYFVNSSANLYDQLYLNNKNSEKKYTIISNSEPVPGTEKIEMKAETYSQRLIPVLYNFYFFQYNIDFNNRNTYQVKPSQIDDYVASFFISNTKVCDITLSDVKVLSNFTYETLYNVNINNMEYPQVYKFNFPTAISNISTAYFTLENGVVQFVSSNNETFNISL